MAHKAIIFDYGNTLAECAAKQLAYQDEQLAELLHELYGAFDEKQFQAQQHKDRRAPYFNGYRENNIAEISSVLVELLFQQPPTEAEMNRIIALRYNSFLNSIRVVDSCNEVLGTLAKQYRLGLLSNYPCSHTIRGSLERNGVAGYFHAIVISGEVGFVKPHSRPFERIIEALEVTPKETVYVGDNWLADIQGAKRMGMGAIHTCQWDTPEKFDAHANDHAPDHTIHDLRELLALRL